MSLIKRSLSLDGHATSVALEAAFWTVIDDYSRQQGRSLASVVGEVDAARGQTPLASALRVWTLQIALNR